MPPIAQKNKANKFWNVANINGNDAELTLYGDICSEKPRDWWTGEEVEGLFITPEGFLEDLEQIKSAHNITVKLNSCGGDLYTGIAIHNALKALKGKKNIIVEGIAASAASIIMCAGDTVSVYPGSLIMIHGVSSMFWDYLNLEDLKKYVKAFDASEKAIAEIYSVKTGMDAEKLRSMMTKETWMTGQQAIDNGFADELLGGAEPEFNYLNNNVLLVNGIKHDISSFNIPKQFIKNIENKGGNGRMNDLQKFLLAFQNFAKGFVNAEGESEGEGEGKDKDKQKEEEQEANKKKAEVSEDEKKKEEEQEAAIQQRIENAVAAERNRLKEIDALPATVSAEFKQDAKYGENRCDAKELALKVLQAENDKLKNNLDNLKKDNEESHANEVEGSQSVADPKNESDEKKAQAREFVAQRQARKQGK